MLWSTSSQNSARQLQLGGGVLKIDYLFAGALAVIIVGSLFLTIYFGFLGGEVSSKEYDPNAHFKCDACGEEFTRNINEVPAAGPGSYGPPPVDCPACGGQGTAWLMIKCPNCDKYYVPESYRRALDILRGAKVKDICPHCGTDKVQWYKEHRKKR